MKPRLNPLTMMLLILLLSFASCAAPAAQPTPTQPPPATATAMQPPSTEVPVTQATQATGLPSATVQDMVECLNAGDVEGSLAYFAENAMGYLVGLPPTGIEVYQGKEELRSLWEDSVSNHLQWEIETRGVGGDVVHVRAKTWHDFTREIGVAPLEWIEVYEVKDGKIATYSSTITEGDLARLKSALAEVMPPEPTATPSSAPPVSEMMVTFSGGTCRTESPMVLQAGVMAVTLDVKDQGNSAYALMVFNLDAGKDFLDLMASTPGYPPSWSDTLLLRELGPGESDTYTFTVEKGPVYLICFSEPPALPIGNAGPFTVVP